MSHVNKMTADRNQRILMELAMQPGNDMCADCKARNPRWASHSLGIFICMNCASIHRKMGTHISKVKSLTMDTWSKEQVEVMKTTGNIRSNAYYNPDETRNPPPTNMVDSERDSELERYIRSKYEFKQFVNRSAQVAALLGPSRSISSGLAPPTRPQTTPSPNTKSAVLPSSSEGPPVPPKTPSTLPAPVPQPSASSFSSPPQSHSQIRSVSQPTQLTTQPTPAPMDNSPWSNLMTTQASPASATSTNSYSMQFASPTSTSQPMQMPFQQIGTPSLPSTNPYNTLSASPSSPFPSPMPMGQMASVSPRSMSLNSGLNLNGGMSSNFTPSFNPSTPFQQPTPTGLGLSTPLMTQNTTSPNPFLPQSLPGGVGTNTNFTGQLSALGSSAFQQQPSPFGHAPQPQVSPLMQMQNLAQPTLPMQQTNPFLQSQPQQQMQTHNPFGGQSQMQTQFMGAPPPFGQPQMQQQPQQPMFTGANPFTGWQNGQQQQGGFAGQQWSGM
ncbi:ArfGap-domain-containing protein [Wolfiporia cocos MD-104 SS10]|uniref:ArfGap-domain-containing protein n=1 Tax=Wolfiporia cocos (strain MD-104) TaxID=742152 RepID=A0A2H3J5N1_WOLCO|nr:ArfGap-domain-containing protein [Wolfiporia cocos MD-104 SS10]